MPPYHWLARKHLFETFSVFTLTFFKVRFQAWSRGLQPRPPHGCGECTSKLHSRSQCFEVISTRKYPKMTQKIEEFSHQ